MPDTPFRRWVRSLTRPAPRRPVRTRRPRLGCEWLEDRITPDTTQLDFHGLRFVATGGEFVLQGDGSYLAEDGRVSVGYTPTTAGDPFVPLIRADLTENQGQARFTIGPAAGGPNQPGFEFEAAPLAVVAVPNTPAIPIAKSLFTPIQIPIQQLTGPGANLDPDAVIPVGIGGVAFTLTSLLFDDPTGPGTHGPQVLFQGTVSFDDIPALADAGVEAAVSGTNYVIADSTGLNLTGATITKNWTVDGVGVQGSITVGYDRPTETFTFDGTVGLTFQNEPSGKAAFNGASAGIDLTVSKGELTAFGLTLGGSFTLLGVTVSTPASDPLSFDYVLPTAGDPSGHFTAGGGLVFAVGSNSVTVLFNGSGGGPGIVVDNGVLTQFDATTEANFSLYGLTVTSPGLSVNYLRATGSVSLTGSLSIGFAGQTIDAFLGTGSDPGLVIVDGVVQSFDIGLAAGLNVYGLKLDIGTPTTPATVSWQGGNTYVITGQFSADFGAFQAALTLGPDKAHGLVIDNGALDISDTAFDFQDKNIDFGPLNIAELDIDYTPVSGGGFDLDVTAYVTFPGGWAVQVQFDLVDDNGVERLSTFSVDLTVPPETLVIPGTGLSIVDIHVKVTNIDNPSQIVVSGGVAMVWGEQISLLGTDCYLFRVEGDILADAGELVIDAQAQFGAFSNDNGATWQGVLGQGDAKLTLDWADNYYALHAEVDGLAGIFDVEGDFVFESGEEIAILAEATVVVPSWVPFIGGDKIGGVGFFFQHVFAHDNVPTSTTFAAWIELDIIWTFTVGFELVYDASGNATFSLIGGGTVSQFEQDVQPPVNQNYTFSSTFQHVASGGQIPADATTLVVGVDWTKTAAGVGLNAAPTFQVVPIVNGQKGTPIPQSQFAANGISFVADSRFSGPTATALQIVGSATDPDIALTSDYEVDVIFSTAGGNPFPDFPSTTAADQLVFQATYHKPNASFGPRNSQPSAYQPVVPASPPAAAFPVTVGGTIDTADAANAVVTLYQVRTDDPFRRALPVAQVTGVTSPGDGTWTATFTVPVEPTTITVTGPGGQTRTVAVPGLYPGAGYVYYAVLADGGYAAYTSGVPTNPPIQSGVSNPVTPVFAVGGRVVNQNTDPQGGWAVYLDYNNNGQQDPTEPGTVTSPGGYYGFTATFPQGSGWSPVPTNAPFPVRLVVQGPQNFAPVTMPTVTYAGTPLTQNFALQQMSAITGTVFVDRNADGADDGDAGVPGAVVYLDVNHDGRRDPGDPSAVTDTAGGYSFPVAAAGGTFTVGVDLSTLAATTPAAAYAVPKNTAGNQSGYTYGMTFDVTKPVVVSQLGVFDSGGDGFHGPLTVALYNRATQSALATLTFTPAAPGTLAGGSRFLPLAAPITLPPGFQGMIVAGGFTSADPAGNANIPTPKAAPAWSVDTGLGRLAFRGSFFTPGAGYPAIVDGSPYPNVYAAGSFLFAAQPWQQTSPTPRERTVTVGPGGFSLQEGNDFGALPPAVVTGLVTGYALKNGKLAADPTPQPGVAVTLLADQTVLAVDAGGGVVGNFQADAYAAGGTPFTTAAAIDTAKAFRPAPMAVYQSGRFAPAGEAGFTYTLPVTAAGRYTVRLHFAEPKFVAPGLRQFNVAVNGTTVLTNFDVVAAAGAVNTAVVEEFTADADPNTPIVVAFTRGPADNPFVNGIEVLAPGQVVGTATTDADGNYVFTTYTPGRYVVQETPPAGWRQVAPFHSDLQFAAPAPLPAGSAGYAVATADFNADGRLDFATVVNSGTPDDPGAATVNVFYNQGGGAFAAADPYTVGYFGYATIVAADLDGDGRPDLAVANSFSTDSHGVHGFLNTGTNAPGQQFQFAADLWTLPPAVNQNTDLYGFAAADLNGDGLDDLLLGYQTYQQNSGAGVAVLLNAAQAGNRTVTPYPLPEAIGVNAAGQVAVGDVNGDGHPDVVTSGGPDDPGDGSVFSVALGDGTGALGTWTVYSAGGATVGPVALGPIAGGARPDIALLYTDPGGPYYSVSTGINRGNGVFDTAAPLFDDTAASLVPAPTRMLLRDVDGDLRPDLVLLQSTVGQGPNGGDQVQVFLNAGTAPYFVPAVGRSFPGGIGVGFPTAGIGVGDFDGDGRADLVVTANDPTRGGVLLLNTSPQNEPGAVLGLATGGTASRVDLVLVQTPTAGAVHGDAYEDANRNGRRDTGDPGRAGTFVFADLNRNRKYDPGEPATATIAGGAYTLAGLAPGTYSVGLVPEDAWRPADPAREFVEVTVTAAAAVRADFGRARRLVAPPAEVTVRAGKEAEADLATTAAAAGRRLVYTLEGEVPEGARIGRLTGEFAWHTRKHERAGVYPITVRVRDPFDPTFTETVELAVRVWPSKSLVVGATPPAGGTPGTVTVVNPGEDADGNGTPDTAATTERTIRPFDAGFAGAIRVASADVTGDGVEDIIAAAGPGGGPHVKVFDGATGTEIASFFAFDPFFSGGLTVAAGDLDGDGVAEVVVAPGPGGGPHVKVFDAAGRERWGFLAYAVGFRGGVRVAVGDLDGDGRAEIVTGTGPGGGPHVKVFDGTTGKELGGYMAYDPVFRDGVEVAAGDIDGDGTDDIVTGPGTGGAPHVRAVSGAMLMTVGAAVPLAEFFAGDPNGRQGARVAVEYLDADARADLLVGTGEAVGSRVLVYRAGEPAGGRVPFDPLEGFPDLFVGGVYLG